MDYCKVQNLPAPEGNDHLSLFSMVQAMISLVSERVELVRKLQKSEDLENV